jgi:hypothetical protein
MGFGMHLRELWRLRWGVVVATLVGLVGALWSVNEISLAPPELTPRSVETAAASTRVLVDTPRSMVLDLRQGTYDFDAMRNRALLIGNVMASRTVREHIAREVGVPADALQVTPPRTPEAPRPRAEVGQEKRATDILKSNDEYRLDIQTNATVPILDVYAQAPTARSAEELANAAVAGTRLYVDQAALSEGTGRGQRVELRQLGAAHGKVLNSGVSVQVGVLAFILFFAVSCAAVMALARIRRGWRMAASEPAAMR